MTRRCPTRSLVHIGLFTLILGCACGGLPELLTGGGTPESTPGLVQGDGVTIHLHARVDAGNQVKLTEVAALPAIQGTAEEREAWAGLKLVGKAWEIDDTSGGAGPFQIELRYDPAEAQGKELMLLAVADGQVFAPRVFAASAQEGYVVAEADHFSTWFVVSSAVGLLTLTYVSWKAYSFTSNEVSPWSLIEPNHPRITEYIAQRGLTMPKVGADATRVPMPNYDRVFLEREDTFNNRVVHLTGKRGSKVLDETKVACWDLTTLFASILYTLDPDIGPRLKLVKGTLDGGRHSWIEVVVDGQVFVVNTARLDAFELVARDLLYREQTLVPTHMYTRDAGSMGPYKADWFEPFLGPNGSVVARIDALKARHRALQTELERLGTKGQSLSPGEVRRMDAIRVEQKQLYREVLGLKKTLPR